jgi:hypothetical protein
VGYLVASSQGNNSYAVYAREGDNPYLGSFRLSAANGIDATEDTDGLDLTNANLGGAYAGGVVVIQDGNNFPQRQNFKLVPWASVASSLGLEVDTRWDPRTVRLPSGPADAGTPGGGGSSSGGGTPDPGGCGTKDGLVIVAAMLFPALVLGRRRSA